MDCEQEANCRMSNITVQLFLMLIPHVVTKANIIFNGLLNGYNLHKQNSISFITEKTIFPNWGFSPVIIELANKGNSIDIKKHHQKNVYTFNIFKLLMV